MVTAEARKEDRWLRNKAQVMSSSLLPATLDIKVNLILTKVGLK
jgi:hypothetical protein